LKPALELTATPVSDKQQLVSELFHALSQPITALRCSLELALHTPSSAPSKENLETALSHAEKIAQLAGGIRELVQADDPGDEEAEIALEDYLQETISDMQPIADAAQVSIEFRGSLHRRVLTEPRRLKQALFYWLEFALMSAAAGSRVEIELDQQSGRGMVTATVMRKHMSANGAGESETKSQNLSRRLGLAIAGRIFEAAGGGLQVQDDEQNLRSRFYLPLVA
jgi:C4-dicarboxylate-specific signal transduction histidine kinase